MIKYLPLFDMYPYNVSCSSVLLYLTGSHYYANHDYHAMGLRTSQVEDDSLDLIRRLLFSRSRKLSMMSSKTRSLVILQNNLFTVLFVALALDLLFEESCQFLDEGMLVDVLHGHRSTQTSSFFTFT